MRRAIFFIPGILIASAVAFHAAAQIAEQKFDDRKAEAGRLVYLKTLAAARLEFSQKQAAALREYSKQLTLGRTAATHAGDLATAVSIDAELKRVNAAIADQDNESGSASAGTQLVIQRARYGVPGHFVDVTDQLRKFVRDGVLLSKDIHTVLVATPDPAPGPDKKLLIEGSFGGKHFMMEGSEDISFGRAQAERRPD